MVAISLPTAPTPVKSYRLSAMDGHFAGQHVITVEQFARHDLQMLFSFAADLRERVLRNDRTLLDLCAGRVMATLFYEASTRTDMSFQAAMSRLGGQVIGTSGGVQFSSVYKGENLVDTVRAAGCYADIVVLRHPEVGSSYESAAALDQLSGRLSRKPVLISGGDGIGEHPTQALLDLFTILDFKHGIDDLNITMVGDLKFGRTVHSLSKLIGRYGAQDITLNFVSPSSLAMPSGILDDLRDAGVVVNETTELDDVLGESDVIYWTRIQEERFDNRADYLNIADHFIMVPEVLARAKSDAILMHPLPRKHEMGTTEDHTVLDADLRSVYFHQMENGMYVRMALIAAVMGVNISLSQE